MTALPLGARLLRQIGLQTWIPFGLRDRLLRHFVNPDTLAPAPFTCDFFGRRYDGDLASFIDWSVFFHGAYERGLLNFLKNAAALGGPQSVFLDIGANVGQHSLFMSAHASHVHAFEPWAVARDAISRKIALNRIANITVHGVGLSDRAHEETFFAPTLSNRGTGSFISGHNLSNRELGRLPLVAGDAYLAEQGIDRVDLIKLDAEGFEPLILAGLTATLRRCRPVVAFEMSMADTRPGQNPASILTPFGDGWTAYVLGGGPDHYQLRPFAEAREGITVVMVPAEKEAGLARAG
ncbi:MAG: FkbM family methyltransferase [Magnetospirillum sp.]|nr:FkbM family methyltransferase [Magnetospirillum sp.]